MDSVKRRLVYIADDSETLLNNLTSDYHSTPRPSRVSRVIITPSSDDHVPPRAIPAPPPNAAGAPNDGPDEEEGNLVDPLVLVSYDGFMLADGSGHLHRPRNMAEAARIRAALHACRAFLHAYGRGVYPLARSSSLTSPGEESSVSRDSSDYNSSDDEYSESGEDSGASSPRRGNKRARRKTPAAVTGRKRARSSGAAAIDPTALTAAQLREELRAADLPTTGNKAALLARLRDHAPNGTAVPAPKSASPVAPPTPRRGSLETPSPRLSRHTALPGSVSPRRSGMAVGPGIVDHLTPGSPSRLSATGTEEFRSLQSARSSVGSLWGSLVNVGSLFFRRSGNWTSPSARGAEGTPPPFKKGRTL